MTVETFSIDYDHRIHCYAVNSRCDYRWYIGITEGSEENLEIQRSIIRGRKTYETLRADLRRGCVLPPVVLSLELDKVPERMRTPPESFYTRNYDHELDEITEALEKIVPENVKIIDGLQRTNAIRSVASELEGLERENFLSRPIRFEAWLNIEFYSLAYRMLLLNAGQKPMSMKHQIEILADAMRSSLAKVDGLELIRGIDKRRRTRPGQFQLSTMAGAFQAWLQRQPNIDLRNAITEQLLADEAIDALGSGLDPNRHVEGEHFNDFVSWLTELDHVLGQDALFFLMNETVVLALSAAVATYMTKGETRDRAQDAMTRLLSEIREKGEAEAFGAEMFNQFRREIDPKKSNVGDATRNLVYRATSEYIMSNGSKSMPECWIFASTSIQ